MKFFISVFVLGLMALTCAAQSTEFASTEHTTKAHTTLFPPEPTPSTDFDCPDDVEDGYFNHPTDCTAYYHCTNGLAWYMQCDAGLYFNSETSLCDWPWNVDCTPGATENPAVRGVSMIDPSPDYECDPEENGAFPHEEFCEYYYDCYNGQATLFVCTDLMLFDLTYYGCNYAQDVDCGNRTRPGGVPTQKPTTTGKPGGGSTEKPFDCPEPEGLFEDPENCAGYYQCYGGNSWHLFCSKFLYFNPKNEVCDYLPQVDCGDRPIIDTRVEDSVVKMLKK